MEVLSTGRREGVGDGVRAHPGARLGAERRRGLSTTTRSLEFGTGWSRAGPRRDGVDLDVLEAAVLLPGGGDGG